MDKRGWITWFMWKTNKTPRQGVLHHLRRPQASSCSPKGEETQKPPRSDLRSPGKISRLGEHPCSRWEFSQKRREREKTTRGKPVFPGTGPFLYFPGPLLYFYLYIQKNVRNRVTQGQLVRLLSAYLCSYEGLTFVLQYLLVWSPINILWPHLSFYW